MKLLCWISFLWKGFCCCFITLGLKRRRPTPQLQDADLVSSAQLSDPKHKDFGPHLTDRVYSVRVTEWITPLPLLSPCLPNIDMVTKPLVTSKAVAGTAITAIPFHAYLGVIDGSVNMAELPVKLFFLSKKKISKRDLLFENKKCFPRHGSYLPW